MSKINNKDLVTTNTQHLMTIPDATSVVAGLNKPEDMNLYPSFKMVYPIEVTGVNGCIFKNDHIRSMVVSDGKNVTKIEAPYTILTISTRNASRFEVKEGNKVEYVRAFDKVKWAGKDYPKFEETPEGYKKYEGSLASYIEQNEAARNKVEGFQSGLSSIIGIITKNGVIIAEFPMFKTLHPYWYKPVTQSLLNGSVQTQLGCKINITDHSENFITSEKGFAYPSKAKFKQFDMTEISAEDLANVFAALRESEDKFLAWLER